MEQHQFTSAETVLRGSGISLLDAARLVRNMLDELSPSMGLSPIQFCNRIIEAGKRVAKFADISPETAFEEYAASKSGLRPDSMRDIKYMGARLIKTSPHYAKRNFSELSAGDCRFWLEKAFNTPSQFNKGRAMLHGFFEYAIRHEWCERNPIKLVERKKIRECEISPLSLSETRKLISTSERHENCAAAVGLLVLAGIRPTEVGKLKWRDIDLSEKGQCKMTYISKDSKITVGDVAKTSGLGGVYPKGITVGKITEIYSENQGVSQYAEVTPAVNFDKIYEVYVITN